MSAGTLYLVPATLGDLKAGLEPGSIDASLPPAVRARISTLTVYAAEDAKSARAFLRATGAPAPLQAIDIIENGQAPEATRRKPLLGKLAAGIDVGVLAEAGCPGIADPGGLLARLAHAAGIRVAPLVGPSSILLALMASGLEGPALRFPRLPAGQAAGPRRRRSANWRRVRAASAETEIVIEAPYRNRALHQALLADLQARYLADRRYRPHPGE